MAHFKHFPTTSAESIATSGAKILSKIFKSSTLGSSINETRLTESIEIWMLGLSDLPEAATFGLRPLARQTGRWHHQITVAGSPTAFLKSKVIGPGGEMEITEAGEGGHVTRIDEVIKFIDRTHLEDDEVRLLSVPAYHVQALWLLKTGKNDMIFPIEGPSTILQIRQLRAADFVKTLLEITPPLGING